MRELSFRLGAHATAYQVHDDLKPIYGARPFSCEVYLQIRPVLLNLNKHGM